MAKFVTLDNLKAFKKKLDATSGSAIAAYPVGAVYISVNSTDPGELFGGTWTRLKDRFLLSAGNTYTAGSSGGEATHTLTKNEMPSHAHDMLYDLALTENAAAKSGYWNQYPWIYTSDSNAKIDGQRVLSKVNSTGGSQAHNNMPPYLTVYMWKRVS